MARRRRCDGICLGKVPLILPLTLYRQDLLRMILFFELEGSDDFRVHFNDKEEVTFHAKFDQPDPANEFQ